MHKPLPSFWNNVALCFGHYYVTEISISMCFHHLGMNIILSMNFNVKIFYNKLETQIWLTFTFTFII